MSSRFLLISIAVLLVGCIPGGSLSTGDDGGSTGQIGGPCNSDGSCTEGAWCVDHVCVVAATSSSATSGVSSSTSLGNPSSVAENSSSVVPSSSSVVPSSSSVVPSSSSVVPSSSSVVPSSSSVVPSSSSVVPSSSSVVPSISSSGVSGPLAIENLTVRVQDRYLCNNTTGGSNAPCADYLATFRLRNSSTSNVRKVEGVRVDIGTATLFAPVMCSSYPWNVTANGVSGTVEVHVSYLNREIVTWCGDFTTRSHFDVTPDPSPYNGSVTLTAVGTLVDAAPWTAEASTTLSDPMTSLEPGAVGNGPAGLVSIENLTVRVQNRYLCNNTTGGSNAPCADYLATFRLRNSSTSNVRKVEGVRVDIGTATLFAPVMCSSYPWNVTANGVSGTVEVHVSYLNREIVTWCGDFTTRSHFDVTPDPSPYDGSVTLTAVGTLVDAAPWTAEASTTLSDPMTSLGPGAGGNGPDGLVSIANLTVRVQDRYLCNNTTGGSNAPCADYLATFRLRNSSTSNVRKVEGVRVDIGTATLFAPVMCSSYPWNVTANGVSGTVEVHVSYLNREIVTWCGDITTRSHFDVTPDPSPYDGLVTLTAVGTLVDAAPWTAEASSTLVP